VGLCPSRAISAFHLGTTLSAETRAAISIALSGRTLSAEHKAAISAAINVALMGNTNAFSYSVFAYDQNQKLVGEFPSQLKAAKYLNVDIKTLRKYLDTGKVMKGGFLVYSSPLS